MSTLSDKIATNALKPQTVSNDGVTVTQRSLADMIAAEKFAAGQTAVASPAAMLKAMQLRIVPPGGH